MKARQGERVFSEQAVIDRIKSKCGTRYQSAQLAAYFGIPTARMTVVLSTLVSAQKVRRVRCGGNPTMYYLPSEAELQAEARAKESRPAPVVITRPEMEGVEG